MKISILFLICCVCIVLTTDRTNADSEQRNDELQLADSESDRTVNRLKALKREKRTLLWWRKKSKPCGGRCCANAYCHNNRCRCHSCYQGDPYSSCTRIHCYRNAHCDETSNSCKCNSGCSHFEPGYGCHRNDHY